MCPGLVSCECRDLRICQLAGVCGAAKVVPFCISGADGTAGVKPAQADRQRFQLHPSVNAWRTYDPNATVDETASITNQIQSLLQVRTG